MNLFVEVICFEKSVTFRNSRPYSLCDFYWRSLPSQLNFYVIWLSPSPSRTIWALASTLKSVFGCSRTSRARIYLSWGSLCLAPVSWPVRFEGEGRELRYYVEHLLGRMPRISVCLRETLSRCSIHRHYSQPGHCFVRKPKADKLGRKAKDPAHLLLCYAKRSHMFLQSSRDNVIKTLQEQGQHLRKR